MKYIIYTDGACSGNPGPGGYGAIIFDGKLVKEIGGFSASTTNNRMELTAAILALKEIKNRSVLKVSAIQIYTDSVYVIKGITQWIFGWKKKNWKNATGDVVTNQDLWEELDHLVYRGFQGIQIKWDYVRGHNQDPGNERCDDIAVHFSKQKEIFLKECSNDEYLFDLNKPPRTEAIPENNFSKSTVDKKKSWYLSLINGVVTKYSTWSECESQVKGRPGVKFKKVSSEIEEADVLKQWGR